MTEERVSADPDFFGRVVDLDFTGAGHQYHYGYDLAGNRSYARVTQATLDSTPHENDRSHKYYYDPLGRLTGADLGALDGQNGLIMPGADVPLTRRQDWGLDHLGNWSAGWGLQTVGLTTKDDTDGDGAFDITREVTHATNDANQVESITTVIDGGEPAADTLVYDEAGNLVFDGEFFYQYDGLNRLAQENDAHRVTTFRTIWVDGSPRCTTKYRSGSRQQASGARRRGRTKRPVRKAGTLQCVKREVSGVR